MNRCSKESDGSATAAAFCALGAGADDLLRLPPHRGYRDPSAEIDVTNLHLVLAKQALAHQRSPKSGD